MALKKNITTRQGIEIKNAYFRVVSVRLNGKSAMEYVVAFSKDADSLAVDSTSHDCAYALDGANPIAQAYEHMKTLPIFADATDC